MSFGGLAEGPCPPLSDVDQYGNPLLGLTLSESRSREACLSREARTAHRWSGPDTGSWAWTQHGPLAPKRIKLLAREGIPAALRPRLWFRFSGGEARRAHHGAGHYSFLVHHPILGRESPPLEVDARFADVWRTLHPGHLLLTRAASVGAAQRIVSAYLAHSDSLVTDTELRHLGCLAAFLFAVMGADHEEEAFFTLLALVEDRLPATCTLQGEDSGVLEQRMLEALLAKGNPHLARSLHEVSLADGELTAGWFPCLFAATLPAETTARVWDALMVEGPKVLFRVGLALLKMNEAALKQTSSLAGRQLKWRIARTYDADLLMKTAFTGVGSLSTALVAKTRLQLLAHGMPHQEHHSPKALSRGFSSRLEALHASSEHLVQGGLGYTYSSASSSRSMSPH